MEARRYHTVLLEDEIGQRDLTAAAAVVVAEPARTGTRC